MVEGCPATAVEWGRCPEASRPAKTLASSTVRSAARGFRRRAAILLKCAEGYSHEVQRSSHDLRRTVCGRGNLYQSRGTPGAHGVWCGNRARRVAPELQ